MWAGRVLHAALSRAPRESRAQSALAQLRGILEEELESIRGAGTWKSERVITSRQGPHIHVDGAPGGIINFCANNYLGLSSHPEVIQAGLRTLKEFGAGLSSVRFICGTQALLTSEDAVLSDELNHASIIDGIRLCKAHKYRYRHLDMADLEAKLQEAQKHRLRLVATDGAFSMDGDIAPLQEICRLASQYGALVFVDESHATGFLGATGRGTDELLGVMDQVTIINSTLGKALGGASGACRLGPLGSLYLHARPWRGLGGGGYTTGPGALVSLLRQRARPYLFSNSLPPAAVGCASKALDLLMESNAIVQSMAAKTLRFRSQMEAAGFTISGANHPICPVMLGDARLALNIADDMLKRGIFVIGFSYPVVPKGKARIRVQISAVHSEEDIDRCVEAFVEVGRLHGALP
ncbi:2-amino-3-ketobutyrate coenzyme A ligase, mitochondrial isoform X3 [Bos javanicus]|uniref:2-amino-3-ketobutyrate coenzyme A ligase, mitochondrial isoform X2 n=1 Tax=Bos taurus TaxID=9913 RepID=UPI0028CB8276|nr:2-amino-3-ketobutyrate coenzyme A ligase, mitochondrial isoform X2 [Bos taurus]XP_061274454.1 2-amino-3-ketobutyrate coenzyme A ligase, mitochondrial isoform X3 [Bos javanicus]